MGRIRQACKIGSIAQAFDSIDCLRHAAGKEIENALKESLIAADGPQFVDHREIEHRRGIQDSGDRKRNAAAHAPPGAERLRRPLGFFLHHATGLIQASLKFG